MPESSNNTPTPPPLYYSPSASDKGRESTSESTPVTTPRVGEAPWPTPFGGVSSSSASSSFKAASRKDKDKDLYFSWHKKTGPAASSNRNSNPLLGADWHFTPDPEEALFEDEGGNSTFPLFPESPPRAYSNSKQAMASAVPIDISLPPRLNSQSPRNHTSNLTFALQEAGASGQQPLDQDVDSRPNPGGLTVGQRADSISNMFGGGSFNDFRGSGARPISVKDRNRRESNTGGSFMGGGMSWGAMSMSSWIRDDVMSGTSPGLINFPRSPSLHSSSYLPKMESNYLQQFNCCGNVIPTLHDLLEHYENAHAGPSYQAARSSISSQTGLPRRQSNGTSTAETTRGFAGVDQQRQQNPRQNGSQGWRQQTSNNFQPTQLATVQDMDALEDMDMDDTTEPTSMPPHRFDVVDARLNTAPAIPAQQAFGRTSTPTTPSANQAFSLFSNPTVSSVNTPALNTQTQQTNSKTPDTSIPGTPAELDAAYQSNFMGMGGFNANTSNDLNLDNFDFGNLGYGGLTTTIGEMTIDDPAKRLFSKQGGGMTNTQMQYAMKNGQLPMDSEMAKLLREQQLVGGLGGPVVGFPEPETKPFKCPVIGCEKAYKNQNGLKYHKQHGHQNQKLKENPDGTFSIVDPITSIPYPGTVGMEKEKPYRCEICGKRYKNLNGLKYHRQHSPPCNPDTKPTGNHVGALGNLGPGVNIAGAGLVGMDGF